jgi:hypothetical protein
MSPDNLLRMAEFTLAAILAGVIVIRRRRRKKSALKNIEI